MDTKGLQKEFVDWCKSNKKQPKSKEETQQLFVTFMKEKHPEEYKAAVENQQKQAQKALHGAKLNYFRTLKNQCPEGEELYYYKKGGSVECGCKKKEDGGEIKKAESGWRANFEKRDSVQTKSDPTEGGKKIYDPNTKKYRPVTEEDKKKWKKNLDDARKGKGEGTPQRKCGGKVKKNEDGSKINKNCGGSAIAKFKMHRQGGSLNGIPFIRKELTKVV